MATHRRLTVPNAPQTVASRLCDEGLVAIVEAAAAEGLHISAKTALRWALHGTRGVRLESVRVGGRRLTSRHAMRRFVAAQQHDAAPAAETIDRAAAEAVLAAHGIGRE